MNTLYIDHRNCSMIVKGTTLELREDGHLEQRIPFRMLDRVVVIGNVTTGTGALAALTAAEIPVTLLSGRHHRHRATLVGAMKANGNRRLLQYRACVDAEIRRDIAQCLLTRKLAAQQRLLHKALHKRPDIRLPLKKAIDKLSGIRARLKVERHGIETMVGLEGAAAAAYFKAYAYLMPSEAGFTGRNRRPPPDPVNAALSLGYTLLYGEAIKAIHNAGLDPALGFLHEPAHGRESLASDLVEPMRSRHDELVWRLFAERHLKCSHFDAHDGGYWLGKKGRAIFYSAYEEMVAPARRWMRLFVIGLVRHIEQSDRG